MASRKIIRKITEIRPTDDEEESGPSMLSDPAEDTYQSYVSQNGQDGVVVKVYRQTEKGKLYCFMGAPNEINDESVRLYHARQVWGREEGMYYLKVLVHGEFRSEFPLPIAPQVATPGASPGGDGGADQTIVRMLMEQNARLEALLLRGGNQQEREPLSATVEALSKLDQMRGQKELPIDSLMKAIELGKSIAGGNPVEGSEWVGLLREAMPAINGLIGSVMQRNNGGNQPQQIAGGQQVGVTNEAMLQAQLKAAIAFLKKKCLAGSHPQLYIEVVADNYEDDATYQELVRRVSTQDFPEFAAIDADIAKPPFEPFFRFIFDGLRSRFKPENPVEAISERESGDTPDAKSNGATRESRRKRS